MMTRTIARFCASVALGTGWLFGATPSALAAETTFAVATNPGGGSILTGTLGGSSLPDATAALMRGIHKHLGTKPSIVQTVVNQHDRSVALLFTAVRANVPYTGLAIVNAGNGADASGAALYDVSSRFHTTVASMVRQLGGMTQPTAAATNTKIQFAPAEPLETRMFTDGTGSIGVPADWTLGGNGGGGAQVNGPVGTAQVSYNMHLMGLDPTSPRSQMLLRMQTPLSRKLFPGVVLAYTSDPVKAWTSMQAAIARKRGLQPPAITITSSSPMAGGANIAGTLGTGPKKIHFIGFVFVLPPDPNGFWNVSDSHMFVTETSLGKEAQTANAVLQSVRINFGAVAQQGDAIRQMFQQKFEQDIANDRAEDRQRQIGTDEALASDRAAQEDMHKEAVSMENYSLDRAVVVDTRNGVHSTVDSGFADTLVHENPNYQQVPAANLLRGVDY